jgi:multidrug efflux pump subunit AcrA (membrane-fusion protein)
MKIKTHFYLSLFFLLSLLSCGGKKEEVQPVRKNITETVFASGSIEAIDKYNLSAQTEGYLLELFVQDGDSVSAGQLLARIDNSSTEAQATSIQQQLTLAEQNVSENGPALKELETNIVFTEKKVAQDKLVYERYSRLIVSDAASQMEFENSKLNYENSVANLKALKERYKNVKQQAEMNRLALQASAKTQTNAALFNEIKALENGKVTKILKKKGDFIRKGDAIAMMANMNTLVAKLNLDENSIAKVQVGQNVHLRLNTTKDELIEGKVLRIYPLFDEASQSYLVDVSFITPLQFNVLGTRLEANIDISTKENVLLIPRSYLSFSETVLVKGEKEPRKVKVGIRSTEYVEILEGLTENDVLQPLKK